MTAPCVCGPVARRMGVIRSGSDGLSVVSLTISDVGLKNPRQTGGHPSYAWIGSHRSKE
jgi:hypothetical protein